MRDKAALPNDAIAAVAANVGVTCNNAITPIITVNNTGVNAITTMTVIPYLDGVAGAPIAWTGNIPVGSTSQVSLTSITSPTAAGAHTFSYNITSLGTAQYNISGNSTMVQFMVAGTPNANPVAEGFDLGLFPPAGWVSMNPDQGGTWVRSTATGGYFQSTSCMKYDFFNNKNIGDKDHLVLPYMDLSGADVPVMSFDWAYCQKTAGSTDELNVMVSDDCGSNWVSVWSASGASLSTAAAQDNAYLPNSADFTQWQTAIVNLTQFNKPAVLVKFVTTSDNGNNLYVDNVNLRQSNPTGISKSNFNGVSVNVAPNPANTAANITVNAAHNSSAKVSVINTLGQVVYSSNVSLTAGTNTISLDVKEYAVGVYNVVVESDNASVTRKLTVSK